MIVLSSESDNWLRPNGSSANQHQVRPIMLLISDFVLSMIRQFVINILLYSP